MARVTVLVLSGDRPLAGAVVTAFRFPGRRKLNVTATTDEAGHADLNLPWGPRGIYVEHPDFATCSVPVEGSGPHVVRLEVAASLRVKVRTEDAHPLSFPDIRIYRDPEATQRVRFQYQQIIPGEFELKPLLRVPLYLWVSEKGYLRARLDGVIPSDGGAVEVALHRGANVAGKILDGEGSPVPGAFVEARSGSEPIWPYATSDAEGSFRVEGVGAPPLRLGVSAARFLHKNAEANPGDESAVIQLEPGGDIELRFAGATVPREVWIETSRPGGDIEAVYGLPVKEGRVKLGSLVGLEWGVFKLDVFADGFEPATIANVELTAERPFVTVDVDLKLGAP